mgnify:CR=1 FL=1
MFSCVSALTAVRAESLIKPVENQRFALPTFAEVRRTLPLSQATACYQGGERAVERLQVDLLQVDDRDVGELA